MKNGKLLDLYSDYLISAFGQTSATGLSSLLNGEICHDQTHRWLADEKQSSADLWRIAKPHVRKIEDENGVMIVDDSNMRSMIFGLPQLFSPQIKRSG
ncbi:MAG: hypothetical protein AABZ00_06890 [Chloroflexota bacterium]